MGDIPYVLRVEFSELATAKTTIVGRPIKCSKCGGFLHNADEILDDPKVGKHFICKFCGTLNVIEGELVIAGSDSDILLEPPLDQSTEAAETPVMAGHAFLAVLDTSGSMHGANLEAVKRSLIGTIDNLAANAPHTLFGVIEFSSDVVAVNISDGTKYPLRDDTYQNYTRMIEATKSMLDNVVLVPVALSADRIKSYIRSLSARGGTALGPAITMALTIAKYKSIDRVLLLTDGLANIGIGSFEGPQIPPASEYYKKLGEIFRKISTVVDIVGIASGSGMELKTLGLMPEATGGQMYYVTPNELDESLAELSGMEVIGRDVEVRLITPPGVHVADASGLSRSIIEELRSSKAGRLGAVAKEQEVFLEVEPESDLEMSEVPIQIQVEYTDSEGARRMRVVTTTLPVAESEHEIAESLDPALCATFATQKAGEEAFAGDAEGGMTRLRKIHASLDRAAESAPVPARREFDRVQSAIAEELREMEAQQTMMAESPTAAAADSFFTSQMKRMRKRTKDMVDDDEV